MYIYKIYKNQKEIKEDIKNKILKSQYIFAFDESIYQMIDDKNYVRMNYFEFMSDAARKSIEKITNVKYQIGDIIKIVGI